jgi:hypothetical protein
MKSDARVALDLYGIVWPPAVVAGRLDLKGPTTFLHCREGTGIMIAIQGLQGLIGIASLVCFILVLVQMFQRGQTALGVLCIVLVFCGGVGGLVAFIYGWINVNTWNIRNIMLAWTVCAVLLIVLSGVAFAMGGLAIPGLR